MKLEALDLFFLLALLGDWFISSNLFFWKKDSGKLIHSFLEGNCIAAMNGMLTVSFVTSTKMCQLLALQHTISFLKLYLHHSTQPILSPVDLYSLISMRPIYYFDTWAIIWHGIVCWFMVFPPFFPVLVCCDHKIVLHWYENQNKNNLVIMLRRSL